MEKKFESLSIFEFQQQFPTEDSCLAYLAEKKWENGFVCAKCSHNKYCNGDSKYSRQCTRCRCISSPQSGTLFHHVKFSILKAFYIVYYVSTNKKGISSTELSRKLGLRQKTCWLFKRKVMVAMKSSGKNLMQGKVEVDETLVGGQEEGVVGRKNGKKKLVVFAVERKGKGIGRLYGKVIKNAGSKELGGFMKQTIDKTAEVKTDAWRSYTSLSKYYEKLHQIPSGKKGENFPDLHRAIMGFKGWLRGMHHHAKDLQAYIDEYTYRFNRNFMTKGLFDNLLLRMVNHPPKTYKMIIS